MKRKLWSEEDYMITIFLYRFGFEPLGLSYGEIANLMERTPNSIIMRFGNYLFYENVGSGLSGGGENVGIMYDKYSKIEKETLQTKVINVLNHKRKMINSK